MAKVTNAGCPAADCAGRITAPQRELCEVELSRLSNVARMRMYGSPGRCFICTACQLVYLKEPAGNVRLGFLKRAVWVPGLPGLVR
jgi:hypothetical protein